MKLLMILWNCMVIAMYLMTGLWWGDLDRLMTDDHVCRPAKRGRNTKPRQERNFWNWRILKVTGKHLIIQTAGKVQ
jgi:hypothetical protein